MLKMLFRKTVPFLTVFLANFFALSVQAQEQLNLPDSPAWGSWKLVQEDKRADNQYTRRYTRNGEPFNEALEFLIISAASATPDGLAKDLTRLRLTEFVTCPGAKINTSPAKSENGVTTAYLQSFCDVRPPKNTFGVVIFRKLISTEKTGFTITRGWQVAPGQAVSSSSTDLKELAQIAKARSETDAYMRNQITVCAANVASANCASTSTVFTNIGAQSASCESQERRTAVAEILLLANACEKKFPELKIQIPGVIDPAVKKYRACFAFYQQSSEEKARLEAISELAGETRLDRSGCIAELKQAVQYVITNVQ
jgi:hypothetical protein